MQFYKHNRLPSYSLFKANGRTGETLRTDLVQANREKKKTSQGGKNMNFCKILVYVMEIIFSYEPNLEIEITTFWTIGV